MTDTTPRAGAPLLAASQAQKSVTHNEALYQFDALLCARFLDRDLSTPPASPTDGDTYLIEATGTGAWTGQDGNIAYCADGAWRFYTPFAGLVAYVSDECALVVFNGTAWVGYGSLLALENVPMLGVNTTADSTNKLAAKSAAVLFDNIGNGTQLKLNKNGSADTASVLYQTSYSGRAEIGLTGDDNFHFKISADGATWCDAMDIAASTGLVSIAAADINSGTADNVALGSTTPSSGAFTSLKSGTSPFAAQTVGATNAAVQIAGGGSAASSLSILRTVNGVTACPTLTLGKSRATVVGGFAAVSNGDAIGKLDFAADDGASYGTVAAEIRATASGSVGTGNVPATLGLYVMNSGVLTEMLHIPNAGDMTLATAGGVQAHIVDVASAADYLTLAGGAAGSPGVVTVGAAGSDTNIDLQLSPKGAGAVRMNTVANGSVATALSSVGPAGAHTSVQEWFAVKNASGVIRYIPAF